jgi:uncharacterized repeat protein (TIGR04138 family)
MQVSNFDVELEKIVARDPRYRHAAYHFLREALDYTQRTAVKAERKEPRHVSGQELLAGIRAYALQQFGPMAMMVLEEWGVRRCEDFGELVFNLVDHNILARTGTDSRADFAGGYDFFAAFREPFLPARRAPAPAPQSKSTHA